MEDRWIVCRRMSGDEICQILSYHMATFIWGANKVRGEQMHEHQIRLLTSVFNLGEIGEFKDKLENPVSVITWDGKKRAWMTTKQVDDMWREVCFLGPMAAMYGREVQQTLMSIDPQIRSELRTSDIQSIWGERP